MSGIFDQHDKAEKGEIMSDKKRIKEMLRYCCDCIYICKPACAPYEPHPESICLSKGIESENYVIKEKIAPLCKYINIEGKCRYFMEKNHE